MSKNFIKVIATILLVIIQLVYKSQAKKGFFVEPVFANTLLVVHIIWVTIYFLDILYDAWKHKRKENKVTSKLMESDDM